MFDNHNRLTLLLVVGGVFAIFIVGWGVLWQQLSVRESSLQPAEVEEVVDDSEESETEAMLRSLDDMEAAVERARSREVGTAEDEEWRILPAEEFYKILEEKDRNEE